MAIKVKKEYAETVVGFNKSSEPLGNRKDLHLLLRDAKASGDKMTLDMFEDVPEDAELQKLQGEAFEAKKTDKKDK